MPIGTETQEKLPDISTKFFSGLKPTKEKDLYPRLIKFCGKDNPNFPEIKLVDTSAHPDPDSKDGAKVKQDVTAYDNNLTIDENSPTRLGDAQFGVEVKDSLIELFYDGGKPQFETMDDAPFETNTDIGKKTRASKEEYAYARALLNDWAPKHEHPVLKMDVHDSNTNQIRQFLVWGSLADPESPLGRATRGYPTVEVTNGLLPGAEPMFLKEQWRSTALGQEVDTLRELNKEGVPYVPTLVCGGDLPGQTTRTQDYATEIERKGDKRLDCRLHVRFVVSEVGFPIERFSSSKQLFQVLYHAFQAHKGTWAFMSIAMLQATGRRHSVSDDLESFFWVALYYSLVYLPHNKLAKLPKIIKTIFEQYEEGDAEDEEATGGKGKRNVVHFGDEIGLGAKQPLEFTQSAPITHFVADMLKLLGEPLKRLPTIGEDPEEDTKVEAMYRDVESIWAATLSSSSWPQSDRGKSQLLKKRGTPDDDQEDDSEERKSKKVKTWHI
ncbi:hypothetical protein EYR36_001570 [Pleurotus pulmonarius]|nr:hypothetical protein EYR36_001570 [Pleurotus pulmonarius]